MNDMIGRPVVVSNYIVSFNSIYTVKEIYKSGYAKCMLHNPSKTTRPKNIHHSDMILINPEDVTIWILKGN